MCMQWIPRYISKHSSELRVTCSVYIFARQKIHHILLTPPNERGGRKVLSMNLARRNSHHHGTGHSSNPHNSLEMYPVPIHSHNPHLLFIWWSSSTAKAIKRELIAIAETSPEQMIWMCEKSKSTLASKRITSSCFTPKNLRWAKFLRTVEGLTKSTRTSRL